MLHVNDTNATPSKHSPSNSISTNNCDTEPEETKQCLKATTNTGKNSAAKYVGAGSALTVAGCALGVVGLLLSPALLGVGIVMAGSGGTLGAVGIHGIVKNKKKQKKEKKVLENEMKEFEENLDKFTEFSNTSPLELQDKG